MTDRLMAIFAYAVLTLFLAILVWYVPRLDLAAVCLLTLLFAGFDFLGGARRRNNRR
jgi:hypothetical protein